MNIKLSTLIFPSIGICVFVFGLGHFLGSRTFTSEDSNLVIGEVESIDTVSTELEPDAPKLDSVEALLSGLESRLKTGPNDVGGWILLSKTYHHLNRWKEAKEAYTKAKNLGYSGDWKPSLQSEFSNFSFDSGTPKIDFSRYQVGNGSDPLLISKNKEKTIAENNYATEVSPDGLKLMLSLAPDLTAIVSPETLLFIFVRKVNESGPPLAVARRQVKDLPLEITLGDNDAMIPTMKISSVDQVVVGARISLTGAPQRQSGDYEQLSAPLPSDYNEAINLIIKEKVTI